MLCNKNRLGTFEDTSQEICSVSLSLGQKKGKKRKKSGVNANVSVGHLSFQLEAKGSRLRTLAAPINITQPCCYLLNCTVVTAHTGFYKEEYVA